MNPTSHARLGAIGVHAGRMVELFRRRVFQQSGIYLLGSLLPRVLGIFLLPIWTAHLAPAEFGVVSACMAMSAFLGAVLTLGVPAALNRFYIDFEGDRPRYRSFFTSNLVFLVLCQGLFAALVLAFGERVWEFLTSGEIPFHPFAALVLGQFIAASVYKALVAVLRVERRAMLSVLVETVPLLAAIGAGLYLVVRAGRGAEGRMEGELAGAAIGLVLAVPFLFRRYLSPRLAAADVVRGLQFGLPLVPHAAAHWFLAISNRILITKFAGAAEAGIYGVAGFVGMTLGMVQQSVNSAWTPVYLRLMREDPAKAAGKASAYFLLWVAGMGLLTVGASLFAKEVLVILADPRYHAAWRLVPPVAIGFFMLGLYFPGVNQLFFFKKNRVVPVVTVTAAAVHVILCVRFIPSHGAMGAAVSSVFSYALLAAGIHFAAIRVHRVGYPTGRLVCGVGLVLLASLGGYWDPGSGNFSLALAVKVAILCAFSGAAYFVLVQPGLALVQGDGAPRSG